MRPVHAAVLLFVLAALAGASLWLWSTTGDEGADALPPVAAETDAGHPRDAEPPEPAQRTAVADPAPPPAVEPTTTAPTGPTAVGSEPAVAASVDLLVSAAVGSTPVAQFQWRFRGADQVLRGTGTGGRAALALPAGAAGELLVEAAGFAPFTQPDVRVPATGSPALRLDVLLQAAAVAAGITLLVRDVGLAPVANVRVDAFALRPEDHDRAWHLGKPLWARRTAAATGRYVLPDLAPGDYGIRVVATDAAGDLLPLLPFARTFALTGSNGFVEEAVLEPGCVPLFDLVDGAGVAMDPTGRSVQLTLRLVGGPAVPRRWLVKTDQGAVAAVDALPRAGRVALAEAVRADNYTFEVHVDGEPRLVQQVTLRAGERQVERFVVQ